jgi:predicted DNA-binding protein
MVKQRKSEKSLPTTQFLIRLPLEVDERLEEDARRCRRSKTRQVEAILMEFYNMESSDLESPRGRGKSTQE